MHSALRRILLLAVAALAVITFAACSKEKTEGVSEEATIAPRYATEAQMLENALKEDPKNLNTLVKLGNLYYDWGQNDVDTKGDMAQPEDKWIRAINFYAQALEIDPSNVDIRVDMANLLRFTGRADEAISQYRTAIKQNPKHVQARINIITALGQQKQDYKGAIAEYEALLKAAPEQKNNTALKQEVDGYKRNLAEEKR